MNLGELKAWCLRTIKRPEKIQDIVDAINASIELASTHGDYAFDLVEGTEALVATDYIQSIVVSSNFPRFRKFKYLRPTGYNKFLKHRDSSRIFQNGQELVDSWYIAGDSLKFKLSALQSSLEYGYFAFPEILEEDADTNGYTASMSSAIHDLSCARVFADMGNDTESRRLELRGLSLLRMHKSDKQDGVSYS